MYVDLILAIIAVLGVGVAFNLIGELVSKS
jgi:hypothetical protein